MLRERDYNMGERLFPAGTPLAMAYVPMQSWETPYPEPVGFQNGTMFPSLYYPFMDMKPMQGEGAQNARKG